MSYYYIMIIFFPCGMFVASWTPHRRSSPAKLKSTDDDTNSSPKNRHYPAQKRSQSITTRNSPLRSTRQKSTSPVRVKTANKALTKLSSPTKEQRTITESLPSLHNRVSIIRSHLVSVSFHAWSVISNI